ncbi:type I-E CRISPR-associated protein Cas6/Cse3/CasE [Chitiniphilus shinanonensis]|uniref:type I-E CRISPR-associated protein Cas6/Cse3/CasE n=1 Tax=Chitiniphilus shinanonensis TaxID=553088 RepID=UPI00305CED58
MFLSRLTLDPRNAQARRDLGDPYEMHRTLARAFVPDADTPPPRFLWCLEPTGNPWASPTLLVQSANREADWSFLQATPGYLQQPVASKRVALDKLLVSGSRYRFRLLANPTVMRQGKRYGLTGETAQLEWLQRQGERHGFTLEAALVTASDMLRGRKESSVISVQRVAYEGVLQALQPDALAQALLAGVGRAKAFGCGLLSLARC